MSAGSGAGGHGGAEEIRRFLDEAFHDGVIDETTYLRLRFALEDREEAGAAVARAAPTREARVVPMAADRRRPAAEREIPAAPPIPPPPPERHGVPSAPEPPAWWKEPQPSPEPPAWAAWLARVRELISSDLTLHGLAYLGVLLVFVGVFGFVVFAFGELDRTLRPVAEAAIPISCFLGAWFLHRQRAPHVAKGIEMLGGLTLPVVAYASFVDDGTVPPDLTGNALVLALAGVSLAIGLAYAAWSVRHADSVLRYLVAPMFWMVAWALGLWFAEGAIAGIAIRELNLWQMALFTTAVALSIALAVALPGRRFAQETRISAIAGLALGYGLILATGFASGWEAGPVALGGAATIVGIELLATSFGERAAMGARLAQAFVVAFTAAALVPDLDPAWTGTAIVVAAIALLERWGRRAGAPERAFALAELAVGLGMATLEPWPMVAAFGIASAWVHVRRVIGSEALGIPARAGRAKPPGAEGAVPASEELEAGSPIDLVAAFLPIGVGVGLWQELGPETGLLVSAIVLLAAAAAYALVGIDVFASIWLVGSAAVIDAATAGPTFDGEATSTLLAVTLVAAGVILAAVPASMPRIWLGSAAIAWAAFVGLELSGVDPAIRAEIFAAAGLGAVLGGAVVARPDTSGLHLELVGLLAGGAAFVAVAGSPDAARLTCLGVWVLAWLLVVVAGEVRGWSRTDLGDIVKIAAPPIALTLLAVFELDAVRYAGLLEDQPELAGVALSALALVEAAGARALGVRHRLGAEVAWSAFAVAAIGLGLSWPERWSLMLGSGTLIGVVVAIPAALRAVVMTWSAWGASALLTVLVAERAGVPTDQLYGVGFVWSSVALLGGLALRTRIAHAHETERPRTPWLEPPVTLGAIGLAASLGVSLLEPPSVYGWWMLGGAAVTTAVTLLLRIPWTSTIPWALAAFGAERLARDLVREEPWIFVAAAAAMLGAAWALSRIPGPEEGSRPDWDLPPFVVAHVVAVSGLALAVSNEVYATTWLAAAALSFAVAAVIRRWEWAVTGAVLAAVGAWDLGPGPLAVALSVESVAAGVAASRLEGSARAWLQLVCVALAAGAWTQTVDAVSWAPDVARRATAIASGTVLLAAALAIRLRRLAGDWLWPFTALGAAGMILTEMQLLELDDPLEGEPATRLSLGAALAMTALAIGIAATPARRPQLRELSAIVAAVAFAEVLIGLELSTERMVGVIVASSVSSMIVSLTLWRTGSLRVWAPPIGLFSALAAVASPPIAATLLPDRGPLVAALLACGVESAAAGVVLRRVEPLVLAPLLLTGAWITFATEAFAGHPQWFTVPIGIAALAVVEVLRWDHRRRHESVRTPEIVALEIAGIAFMIGGSPIQVIQGSTWAGLVGVVLGIFVTAWGALTRVRRRLWLGVVSAVGCLLLMVLVPLTRQLPDVASAEPWLLLGVIGVAVVVIATVLERGRARLRAAIHHVGELLEGWE